MLTTLSRKQGNDHLFRLNFKLNFTVCIELEKKFDACQPMLPTSRVGKASAAMTLEGRCKPYNKLRSCFWLPRNKKRVAHAHPQNQKVSTNADPTGGREAT